MRWLLVAIFSWFGFSVHAQTVRVTTGDHPGFTRVVLEAPGLAGWRLSRLPDGYLLRLRSPVRFDLKDTFRVISRDRLTQLLPSGDGVGLEMTVGCACHAIGYDFRPGIVVVDLRDGPPPAGSSFELSADGTPMPTIEPAQAARPEEPSWDWVSHLLSGTKVTEAEPPIAAPRLPDAQTLALRATLLGELADGVARGLVTPVSRLPEDPPEAAKAGAAGRTALLELPGLTGLFPQDDRPPIAASGQSCLPDARLDLSAWGRADLPPSAQLSGMDAFLGEFDRPDPDRLAQAVHRYLWLGFGVEAEAMVDAFVPDGPDASLWRAMAKAIDGETQGEGPFTAMSGCDGWAAFWSVLSAPKISQSDTNAPAVLRSFSALPTHLRQYLGPTLTERFLESKDGVTAQGLRDAMVRGDPASGALVDARIALHDERPAVAEADARAALAEAGPDSAAALATLVEARFQARKSVDAADVTAVEALLAAQPEDKALGRALVLGRALAGDFDAAFGDLADLANTDPATRTDLWSLLAETGPDSTLIFQGVGSAGSVPLPVTVRNKLAERLTALGFGGAARIWLGPEGDPIPLAIADLSEGDARTALHLMTGRVDKESARVRAQALMKLGEPAAAADLLANVEGQNGSAEVSARLAARDWTYLQKNGSPSWQTAARTLQGTERLGSPLADGRAVLEGSAKTRVAIETLLATVPTSPAAE